MPDMSATAALDVLIGLSLLFAVLSIVCAGIVHLISTFIGGSRGAYLDPRRVERVLDFRPREAQILIAAIATVAVLGANLDAIAIGQSLWKDDAVRAVAVAEATRDEAPASPQSTDAAVDEVEELQQLGIPVGWSAETTPDDAGDWINKLFGWLTTAIVASVGAPFVLDRLSGTTRRRVTRRVTKEIAPGDPEA